MEWLMFALLSVFLFTLTNIIDSHLSNKTFSNIWSLLFYVNILNVVFLPLLWLVGTPRMPVGIEWLQLATAGILFSISGYFYYKAFQHDDTSTTMSLFSLEYIFTPFLAYLFLHEVMHLNQYIGILILAFCAFMLTWKARLNFSKALIYMIFAVLMVVAFDLLLKSVTDRAGWITASFWVYLFGIFVSFIIWPFQHKVIKASWSREFKPGLKIMLINELISFLALAIMAYTYSIAPLTLVIGVFATKPFMILILSVIGHQFWPGTFKEDITTKILVKKSVLFALMIVGIILLMN